MSERKIRIYVETLSLFFNPSHLDASKQARAGMQETPQARVHLSSVQHWMLLDLGL